MKTYKYKIVNGDLQKFNLQDTRVSYNEYGLPVYIDDYGMGAVHWPLIKDKDEQDQRQSLEDIIWAVDRLKWATENNPSERPELILTILRGRR